MKAGLVVGVSGGSGTLTFEGKDYPISISGISLGATIGASKAEFVGDVYNLSAPGDIEGVYSGAKAGIAVAGGRKVAELKSSKGVVLKVSGKQIGVELTLDLNGMQISLKEQPKTSTASPRTIESKSFEGRLALLSEGSSWPSER